MQQQTTTCNLVHSSSFSSYEWSSLSSSIKMSIANRMRIALGEHNFFGFHWIIEKFNDYDVNRINEIGKDRGCAEWLLRCGGTVRFDRYKEDISDYNSLMHKTAVIDPRVETQQVFLTHAHAVNACVTARGCRHFNGLTRLVDARFVNCKNLEDEGIHKFVEYVGSSIESVEVSSCRYLTEKGLSVLKDCPSLHSLILSDLRKVKNPHRLFDTLKENLPSNCQLFYPDVTKKTK